MPKFSSESEAKLATVHPDLVKVMRTAIQIKDFKILEGHRSPEDQEAAFARGVSKVHADKSTHCRTPSAAVDVIPFDPVTGKVVSWDDQHEFVLLAGVILAGAFLLNVPIRWGHDWNRNMMMTDEKGKLVDMPHFELMEHRKEAGA